MKTAIIILLLSGVVLAGNPDERTSLTIRAGADVLNGDYTASFPIELVSGDTVYIEEKQDGRYHNFQGALELIVPVDDNVSFISNFSYLNGTSDFKETNFYVHSENNINGFSFNLAVKLYFGKGK